MYTTHRCVQHTDVYNTQMYKCKKYNWLLFFQRIQTMSAPHPMCRSFSSESQRKDWGKRLSLRGNPRNKEVQNILISKFSSK